jgi:hypothetical protein
MGFAKLYMDKTAITAADFLNDKVLPVFDQEQMRLFRVLTDRGTEYSGKIEQHPYQLFLHLNDIEHSRTKAFHPQTNGCTERLNQIIQDEFYAVAFNFQDQSVNLSTTLSGVKDITLAFVGNKGILNFKSLVFSKNTILVGDLIPYANLISLGDQTQAPFAFGQVLRPGEFPPNSQIKTNLANTQVTIKNRWPDGSPKFAIVAGRTNLTGNSPLKVSFASSDGAAAGSMLTEADLKALNLNAAIEFSPFGSVNLGSLIGVASTVGASGRYSAGRVLEFIRGPEMSSWIYYSPIGTDPHLTAWFEVRLYRGGSVEILPWIENGFLNVAGPTNKIGTATFRLGGSTRFTSSIELKNHTRTYLGSGTTFSHFLGADPQVTVVHNVIHLQSTRATPSYFAKTTADSTLWSGLAKTFTPLAQASPMRSQIKHPEHSLPINVWSIHPTGMPLWRIREIRLSGPLHLEMMGIEKGGLQ